MLEATPIFEYPFGNWHPECFRVGAASVDEFIFEVDEYEQAERIVLTSMLRLTMCETVYHRVFVKIISLLLLFILFIHQASYVEASRWTF